MAPTSSKELLDIQGNYKYRFTLKLERDMIISYSHWKLCFVEKSLQIFKKNEVGFRILSFFRDVSENKIMVFNNENNDFNPLTAYYFSFMVHLWMFIVFLIHICLFYFRFIFSTNLLWPSGCLSSRIRKWGHWSRVWNMFGVGDEDSTTMSMTSFWCFCCLLWTCFALPSPLSVFYFRHVGVCGSYLL